VEAVAARLAALEGVEDATLLASGSAALLATLLAAVPPGGRLVASRMVCGDAHRLLTRDLPALGRDVALVDVDDAEGWRREGGTADALFVEALSNPMLRVADLPLLARVAAHGDALLVVDATLATPVNLRPAEHGADLVVHSATKALNGHCDLTAGAVAGPADLVARVRGQAEVLGACLDPGAAFLLERGLKTLVLRVERQNETARSVARVLAARTDLQAIHPELPSHPDQALARRLLGGTAGLVSLQVDGDERRAARVVRRLALIGAAPTLGGVESLAVAVSTGSHASLDVRERRRAGIPPRVVRLSLGIEDAADLIGDLEQALDAVAATSPVRRRVP
jgi:cystathionine beta-lyase/cystathionine gamma-synthase